MTAKTKPNSTNGLFRCILSSTSLVAMCAAMPVAAIAQETDTPVEASETDEAEARQDTIVVQGLRQSLKNAQALKQNADTFVDAITADDIAGLPDRSVSEALQRVPGVNVLRFAGPDDPDHFAVEGAGVSVRGFPFVRSELNGRDVFGANSGGTLGFDDVSPELLGSVVVFKNQSADLIEGGLAGSIDLRTRLPFDSSDRVLAFSAEGTYSDLSQEVTPSFSGLYSDNWDTENGRFGVLLNFSTSQLKSRADAVSLAAWDPVVRDDTGGTGYVPAGGGIRSQIFDRERESIAGALQWESPDKKWLATAQFMRSDSSNLWGENSLETGADSAGARQNFDQTDFVFGDNGVLQSGTLTDNSQWRGPNGNAAFVSTTGGQQIALRRERLEEDTTTDFGVNLKYSVSDNLRFNFDAQYIESEAQITDLTNHLSFFAPVSFKLNGEDESPQFQYVLPTGQADTNFQNLQRYFFRSAMDHLTDNEADSVAFRGDVEYDFSGDGWLKSVRGGARYSEQDYLLRQSDFNWGQISEVWTGFDAQGQASGPASLVLAGNNPNPSVEAIVSPLVGYYNLDDFNRGDETGLMGPIPFWNGPGVEDYEAWAAAVTALRTAGLGTGGPATLNNRTGLVGNSPFTLGEIGEVTRETAAAFVRLDFGTDTLLDSNIGLAGNVGLRYVSTTRTVDTALRVDSFAQTFPNANVCDPNDPARLDPSFSEPGFCAVDLAAAAAFFGAGATFTQPTEVDYSEVLPSLNLKMDFGNGHLMRFAASKTMSRPSIDQVNERIAISTLPDIVTPDGSGGQINSFGGFTASGFGASGTGNSSLTPQIATNLDLSWEWYFADTGSLTVGAFYKDIDDYINFEPTAITATNNGVDFTTVRNTEVNVAGNAELTGFEISYQQFYDFLPAPFDGFGVQANYAYIDAEGVPAVLDPDLPSDDPPTARFDVDASQFPRVSEHNLNLIGLYEKDAWQGRLAWNWRSEFQLTPRDVIFPFATVYQPATGQLDGSIFYTVNDNWKVGVQAVNLLDDVTVTEQSINTDGLRAPRNYFRNDRRFSFILRANF